MGQRPCERRFAGTWSADQDKDRSAIRQVVVDVRLHGDVFTFHTLPQERIEAVTPQLVRINAPFRRRHIASRDRNLRDFDRILLKTQGLQVHTDHIHKSALGESAGDHDIEVRGFLGEVSHFYLVEGEVFRDKHTVRSAPYLLLTRTDGEEQTTTLLVFVEVLERAAKRTLLAKDVFDPLVDLFLVSTEVKAQLLTVDVEVQLSGTGCPEQASSPHQVAVDQHCVALQRFEKAVIVNSVCVHVYLFSII